MIKIIKELKIEVSKPNVFQTIVAKQYDMNTRYLKVTFIDCGYVVHIPYSSTMQVVINANRRDGQSKAFYGVINEDGTVTVPLHSWMLELDGTVVCDISVIDSGAEDDQKLTTTSFTLLVEKAAYGGNDVSTDPQRDALVELIERVEEVEKGAADQTYKPESALAQSGRAVAEAVNSSKAEIETELEKITEIQNTLVDGVKPRSIIPTVSGESILLTDSSRCPLEGLKVYGRSVQNGTPTPEAPIDIVSAGASGSVAVKSYGGNIFNPNVSVFNYGISTYDVLENGRVLKFTGGEIPWAQCTIKLETTPGVRYTVLCDKITSTGSSILELRKNSTAITQINSTAYVFTAEETYYELNFIVNFSEDTLTKPITATYEGVRIIVGDKAIPWEEYKEPQTLSLATPNELRGLAVRSDDPTWNYIDASGSKWICDYIDLEKNALVQNCVVITLDGNANWSKSASSDTYYEAKCWLETGLTPTSTRGGYSNLVPHQVFVSGKNFFNVGSNLAYLSFDQTYFSGKTPTLEDIKALLNITPLKICTYRATPLEIPLSAEEIAYYKALHTNYPNTTIFNSDGTRMEVSYVADPKLYIDNKFAELEKAIAAKT